MKGLKPDFESLPRVQIRTHTTGASGAPREDCFDAIPLADALMGEAHSRVTVRARDGAALAFRASDVKDACLVPLEGGWQLIFIRDTTRQRRIKQPECFEIE